MSRAHPGQQLSRSRLHRPRSRNQRARVRRDRFSSRQRGSGERFPHARGALSHGTELHRSRGTKGSNLGFPTAFDLFELARRFHGIRPRKLGSQQTPRWREVDSNPRSLSTKSRYLSWRSGRTKQFLKGFFVLRTRGSNLAPSGAGQSVSSLSALTEALCHLPRAVRQRRNLTALVAPAST